MRPKRSSINKYAPQMRVYNRYSHTWKPYIMFSNASNLRTEVLNTDHLGLRFNSTYNDKFRPKNIFDQKNGKNERGAIFGASTAFGLGASKDEATISSQLSKDTDVFFYNLGISAFTGFQEVVLHQSLINYFDKIKYLIVLSGVNDLLLVNYIQEYDEELGPYFYNTHFLSGMDNMTLNNKRKVAKFFLSPFTYNDVDWTNITKKQLFEIILKNKKFKKTTFDNNTKDNLLKKYLIRNFTYWSNIQKIYKVKFFYVLQPFSTWCDKILSVEEKEIFTELDSNNLKVFNIIKSLEGAYSKYVGYVSEYCNKYNINFIDSNKYFKANIKANDWCFIDRLHLTDLGNKYMANLLKSVIAS